LSLQGPLRETLTLNNITNVTLVESALLDKVGTARLQFHGTPELGSLEIRDDDDEKSITQGTDVSTTTLDNYMQEQGIDCQTIKFVKMDVEGVEIKVIAGGSSLFEEASPIVQFESQNGITLNVDVVDAFERRGYTIYQLLSGPCLLVPYSPKHLAYVLNLFAIKPKQCEDLAARGLLLLSPAKICPAALNAEQLDTNIEDRRGSDGVQEVLRCHPAAFVQLLQSLPAYKQLLCLWNIDLPGPEASAEHGKWWVDVSVAASLRPHLDAMNLYAIFCNNTMPCATRLLALQELRQRLPLLCSSDECSRGELLTYVRIGCDIGCRVEALEALHQLLKQDNLPRIWSGNAPLETAETPLNDIFSIPFLAPRLSEQEMLQRDTSAAAAGISQADAAWYEATVLFEKVRLQWHSLAYAADSEIPVVLNSLRRIMELGFYKTETSGRLQVALERSRLLKNKLW